MRIIFTIIFFITSISGFSQDYNKLTGMLKDSDTGELVEYANIILLTKDSLYLNGGITDSLGQFIIDIPSKSIREDLLLQINHLNYEKKYINLKPELNSFLEIEIQAKDNSLSEIQVLGNYTLIKSNAAKLEYRVTDKMRQNSLIATQIIENIPGVFVDYNKNIMIKGNTNILILKNGMELSNNIMVNQIPTASIEKIEIIHSIPSKYASRNYTAIMNIITKKVNNKSLLLDNNSSFDGQMYDAKVNFSIDTQKHSFYVYYKLYYRNFMEKFSIYNIIGDAAIDTTYYYRTKPRKESDNEFFYGYTYHANDKLAIGFDGYNSLYKEVFKSSFDDYKRLEYSNFKEDVNSQNYKTFVSFKDSLNQLTGVLQYNDKKVSDNNTYYQDSWVDFQKERRKSYNGQIDYLYQYKPNITLATGLNYDHITTSGTTSKSFQSTETIDEEYKGNNVSAYTETSMTFGKWLFEAGVNLHNYNRNFKNSDIKINSFNFYPRLTANYNLNSNSFKISYYSYIKVPIIWQMLSIIRQQSPDLYYIGNPYLKPERHGVFSFEHNYSKGSFYISNEMFYKRVKNNIQDVLKNSDGNQLLTGTNLDKRNDYGYNISLGFDITDWWKVNSYASFFRRNIPDNVFYKKNMSSFQGNLFSTWNITKKLELTCQYMYNGEALTYNGARSAYNTSLIVMEYKLLDNLNLYFLAIQPFDCFESISKIYNENGSVIKVNNIKVRTYLVSFTYNVFNNNKKKKKTYQNYEKKY